MASKRNLRRRHCEGKRRYPDEKAARSAMRLCAAWMRDADRLDPYRCAFCGSWHFGHRVERDIRGRAAA